MYTLQPPVRLYASRIWALQRESYTAHGPRAWLDGGVPMQVVNNPFIARAYARIIRGALRDLLALGDGPVTLVELGAGSGRFGFLLLRALEALEASDPLPARPYRLVMTDLAQANLDAWAAHPQLAPYVADGRLAFARFDAADPGALPGPELDPDQPVIALANYLFDTIPSDAFRIEGGQLFERRLSLHLPAEPTPDAPLSSVLERLTCGAELRPIDGDYYGDPHRDGALRQLARSLRADTTFLFPEGALRVIEHLAARASGLFLLASDKGNADPAGLEGAEDIELTPHGEAFSVMVNFDLIGRYLRSRGGRFWTDPFADETLTTVAAALDLPDMPRAARSFERELGSFHPLHYQELLTELQEQPEPSPLSILRLLQLGRCDPEVLTQLADPLMERAEELEEAHIDQLEAAAEAAWDQDFDVGDPDRDLAFAAGAALQCAGRPERALGWYARSLERCGPHRATHLNIGMCLDSLGRTGEALGHAREALALEPEAADARELLEELLAKLGLSGSE